MHEDEGRKDVIDVLLDETKYFGIYRDDEIGSSQFSLEQSWTQTEVEDWLLTFQRAINDKA
jgi:hypothetical protein